MPGQHRPTKPTLWKEISSLCSLWSFYFSQQKMGKMLITQFIMYNQMCEPSQFWILFMFIYYTIHAFTFIKLNLPRIPHLAFIRFITISIWAKRSLFFATNSDFLIQISLKSNVVKLWYFKLILFNLTELIVWNIKGLRHWNLKI